MEATAGSGRRPVLLAVLVVVTVAYVLSLAPALMALLMSPMAFDSGPSPEAWALVAALVTYPFWVVLALASMWLAFRKRSTAWAVLSIFLPIPGVLLAAATGAVIFGS